MQKISYLKQKNKKIPPIWLIALFFIITIISLFYCSAIVTCLFGLITFYLFQRRQENKFVSELIDDFERVKKVNHVNIRKTYSEISRDIYDDDSEDLFNHR